jgi:hypothetical protein
MTTRELPLEALPVDINSMEMNSVRTRSTEIKAIILSEFETVAREQDKNLSSLTDDTMLLESGLDSLCFAIIVARLEDSLGYDPFQTASDRDFPMTVGEFIEFYEHAAP